MIDPQTPGHGAMRSAAAVQVMFGRIVRRYDTMNRLMTGGRDGAWRRRAVRLALQGTEFGAVRVLDVATGTGDLALALADGGAESVVGSDFAAPMIRAATVKQRSRVSTNSGRVDWLVADALRLPFPEDVFDACTVSFGLRNMADYGAGLREMARVLRPGGRLVCLELTPYRRAILRYMFQWYFSRVVPIAGWVLSGDRDAYRYLPKSVDAFPDAATLSAMMRASGLEDVSYRLLGAGTVALHVGRKAEIGQSGVHPLNYYASPGEAGLSA